MSTDARISTGLPGHPKTKKLVRRLGPAAGWSLLCLILWTRGNRPDGDLAGMSSEDIELAADWTGENNAFVRELDDVGFLDGEELAYALHDWAEHQPWSAGSEARSEKSRFAALCKRYGRDEAERLMPEYAARLREASQRHAKTDSKVATGSDNALPESASSMPNTCQGVPLAETGNAPSPIPIPIPIPIPSPNTPLPPKGGARRRAPGLPRELEPAGFVAFWEAWPPGKRKESRGHCAHLWVEHGYEPIAGEVLAHVMAKRDHTDWAHDGGQFVEAPLVYLRNKRWDGAEVTATKDSNRSEVAL